MVFLDPVAILKFSYLNVRGFRLAFLWSWRSCVYPCRVRGHVLPVDFCLLAPQRLPLIHMKILQLFMVWVLCLWWKASIAHWKWDSGIACLLWSSVAAIVVLVYRDTSIKEGHSAGRLGGELMSGLAPLATSRCPHRHVCSTSALGVSWSHGQSSPRTNWLKS